jgi:hypothetical protein
MTFTKGQRVRHPTRPDWGLGEVREDAAHGRARVFFVNAGERIISLTHVALIPSDGADAADSLLDNLTDHDGPSEADYQPLSTSIANFLRRYPGGFYGAKFAREERDYKVAAHKLCRNLLSKSRFGRLLTGHSYAEATRDALRVVNATNLIFPNEKMSLRDGLRGARREQQFCEALFSILHDVGTSQGRFTGFSRVLDELQAAKWTIATYYQFLYDPDNFMFLKPVATQRAARTCRFDIHYKPDLNWRTYDSVQAFARYLRDELRELKPRDMIDIQSFMWTVRRIGGEAGT